MSLFLRSECQIIHFEFIYYSFFLNIHLELKQQTHLYTPIDLSKTIPNSRPKWAKCIPIFRPKQCKTIPFGVAHTYIAYITVYLPASAYNNAFNLELIHLLQLSVMRNSTWLGSCLIMTFPMKAIFHASLVLWNILLMEASYAGYISFCHQVSYYYYYYYYSLYHYVICMIASFWLQLLKTVRVFFFFAQAD